MTVGAKSVGLNIELPHEQFPNPYVTPDLCFRFHYFALRKLHLLLRAKALVAFPGGYGTFDELFEVLTLVQTRKIKPIPVILVSEQFWRRAVDFDFLVEEGVIDVEDRELFWFAETAQDIWNGILDWYKAAGEPLLALWLRLYRGGRLISLNRLSAASAIITRMKTSINLDRLLRLPSAAWRSVLRFAVVLLPVTIVIAPLSPG